MGRRNIIAGTVLFAIGLGYGYMAGQLPERAVKGVPGISFFPWLIAISIMGLSLAMTVQGWRRIRQGETAYEGRLLNARAAAILLTFVAYIAALPHLGFIFAGVPFFTFLMWLYGGRNKWLLAIAGPGIPIVLYYLFRHVFLIPLPRATLSILGG